METDEVKEIQVISMPSFENSEIIQLKQTILMVCVKMISQTPHCWAPQDSQEESF